MLNLNALRSRANTPRSEGAAETARANGLDDCYPKVLPLSLRNQ